MAMAQRTLGSVLAIMGGLLLAVGAFLPWVKIGPGLVANPPPVSSWDTVSGIDGHEWFLVGDDGIFFLIGGVLIAALGLWTILSPPKAAPILLILSGLAFGLLGWFEFASIGHSVPCCDFFYHPGGRGHLVDLRRGRCHLPRWPRPLCPSRADERRRCSRARGTGIACRSPPADQMTLGGPIGAGTRFCHG